jgi:hypothetical protein
LSGASPSSLGCYWPYRQQPGVDVIMLLPHHCCCGKILLVFGKFSRLV